MYIPNIQANLTPLILESPGPQDSPDSPDNSNSPDSQESPILYTLSLQFSLHLALISLFETIFFWKFVSQTENEALIKLVNNYASGILSTCANMSESQRQLTRTVFNIFINQTSVDNAGSTSLTARTAYNNNLIRTSWLYCGGISTVFVGIALTGQLKGYKTEWASILREHIALITLLGLYEWMFFSTIVLNYQAVSMPELDSMVINQFESQC